MLITRSNPSDSTQWIPLADFHNQMRLLKKYEFIAFCERLGAKVGSILTYALPIWPLANNQSLEVYMCDVKRHADKEVGP